MKYDLFIIIINVSLASNHHIRVISEGSCDTEDFDHRSTLHFTIYSHNNISQYFSLYCIFDQIKAVCE